MSLSHPRLCFPSGFSSSGLLLKRWPKQNDESSMMHEARDKIVASYFSLLQPYQTFQGEGKECGKVLTSLLWYKHSHDTTSNNAKFRKEKQGTKRVYHRQTETFYKPDVGLIGYSLFVFHGSLSRTSDLWSAFHNSDSPTDLYSGSVQYEFRPGNGNPYGCVRCFPQYFQSWRWIISYNTLQPRRPPNFSRFIRHSHSSCRVFLSAPHHFCVWCSSD